MRKPNKATNIFWVLLLLFHPPPALLGEKTERSIAVIPCGSKQTSSFTLHLREHLRSSSLFRSSSYTLRQAARLWTGAWRFLFNVRKAFIMFLWDSPKHHFKTWSRLILMSKMKISSMIQWAQSGISLPLLFGTPLQYRWALDLRRLMAKYKGDHNFVTSLCYRLKHEERSLIKVLTRHTTSSTCTEELEAIGLRRIRLQLGSSRSNAEAQCNRHQKVFIEMWATMNGCSPNHFLWINLMRHKEKSGRRSFWS